MTLYELLKKLKGIDPETADDIGDIVNVISILSYVSFSSDAYYPDIIPISSSRAVSSGPSNDGWITGPKKVTKRGG